MWIEREISAELRQLARAFVACTTDTPHDIAPGITAVNGWRTWPLTD